MKSWFVGVTIALLVVAPCPPEARTEIIDSSGHGFTVKNIVNVARPAPEVYSRLLQIGMWWDSAHTYSGDAHNLTLDGRANGAFSEKLPGGGSILHGTVLYADPGKTLRLTAALGPLQSLAATGTLTWSLAGSEGGTKIELVYTVGGYDPGGFRGLPRIVDMVLAIQLRRLQRYVDTGAPSSR